MPIDKYVRQIGLNRATDAAVKSLSADERVALQNYAAGVNKVVENIAVYPLEFQLGYFDFEPWTMKDSVSIANLLLGLGSTDWYVEMLRLRLLEVYDRDLVD